MTMSTTPEQVGEWSLSVHASKRRRQRHLSLVEILRIVEEPELAYRTTHHDGCEHRIRGRWDVVVDPETMTVVTITKQPRKAIQ